MEEKKSRVERALIPKGTYVPSKLSHEQRLKQAISNNPNTMSSEEEILGRLGFVKETLPVSRKLTSKTVG